MVVKNPNTYFVNRSHRLYLNAITYFNVFSDIVARGLHVDFRGKRVSPPQKVTQAPFLVGAGSVNGNSLLSSIKRYKALSPIGKAINSKDWTWAEEDMWDSSWWRWFYLCRKRQCVSLALQFTGPVTALGEQNHQHWDLWFVPWHSILLSSLRRRRLLPADVIAARECGWGWGEGRLWRDERHTEENK